MRKELRLPVVLITSALILRLAVPAQLTLAADGSTKSKGQLNRAAVHTRTREDKPALAELPHNANANSTAAHPSLVANSLPDCGGEGESPCSVTTEFFWDNGNLFCDRGLQATGFKVIGGPIYFNANDWLNLNRANLTKLIKLMQEDLPTLQNRVNNLDTGDFLS